MGIPAGGAQGMGRPNNPDLLAWACWCRVSAPSLFLSARQADLAAGIHIATKDHRTRLEPVSPMGRAGQ